MEMTFEPRMLIDGELVEATAGATYDNINPATEEVIGPVADASPADMERAIAAARRAFDETDWATDRALRKACLRQLKEALDKHKEELRPQIVAEVGAPIGAHVRDPAGHLHRRHAVGHRPASTATSGSTSSASTSSSA